MLRILNFILNRMSTRFQLGSMEMEWSGSKLKKYISFCSVWPLNTNYLLNLVLESQREKWFNYIYSDDVSIANVVC